MFIKVFSLKTAVEIYISHGVAETRRLIFLQLPLFVWLARLPSRRYVKEYKYLIDSNSVPHPSLATAYAARFDRRISALRVRQIHSLLRFNYLKGLHTSRR